MDGMESLTWQFEFAAQEWIDSGFLKGFWGGKLSSGELGGLEPLGRSMLHVIDNLQ